MSDDIAPDVRRAVLKRDEYRCRCCGDEYLEALTLHHVVYRSQSGGHDEDNLVTVCWDCHMKIHKKQLTVAFLNGHWFFGDTKHWRNNLRR